MSELVSCICVTRNRTPLLARAISCFLNQTHLESELVIVCEEDDPETIEYLSSNFNNDSRLRLVVAGSDPKITLGDLRNLGINSCRGDYICQWDDDDWYHQNRITAQLARIKDSGRPACVLGRWVIYDSIGRQAYWSRRRAWEGSIVCVRSELGSYPSLPRGEDTPVIKMLELDDKLAFLDRPELYIYVFHGNNTWGKNRWRKKFRLSEPFSESENQRVIELLTIA